MTHQFKGIHYQRTLREADEKVFAEAWAEQNKYGHTLAYLLWEGDQGGNPPEPSDRDHAVAATVIQWLGSHVGRGWLSELGYEKVR